MLVHCKVDPIIEFAGTHLHVYTEVKRGTVRLRCLGSAQEHDTMSLARARTTRSEGEHANIEPVRFPKLLKILHLK